MAGNPLSFSSLNGNARGHMVDVPLPNGAPEAPHWIVLAAGCVKAGISDPSAGSCKTCGARCQVPIARHTRTRRWGDEVRMNNDDDNTYQIFICMRKDENSIQV